MENKNGKSDQVVRLDPTSQELLARALTEYGSLKERIDRHSMRYERQQEIVFQAIKEFSHELKDIRKEFSDKAEKLSKEISNARLEGLKNDVKFTLKTIGIIGTIATIFGAAGAGLKDLIVK